LQPLIFGLELPVSSYEHVDAVDYLPEPIRLRIAAPTTSNSCHVLWH